jgi:hypothetical protein
MKWGLVWPPAPTTSLSVHSELRSSAPGVSGANRLWHGGVKAWFDNRLETSIRFSLRLSFALFLLLSR